MQTWFGCATALALLTQSGGECVASSRPFSRQYSSAVTKSSSGAVISVRAPRVGLLRLAGGFNVGDGEKMNVTSCFELGGSCAASGNEQGALSTALADALATALAEDGDEAFAEMFGMC